MVMCPGPDHGIADSRRRQAIPGIINNRVEPGDRGIQGPDEGRDSAATCGRVKGALNANNAIRVVTGSAVTNCRPSQVLGVCIGLY
jgi:hypothetical protein